MNNVFLELLVRAVPAVLVGVRVEVDVGCLSFFTGRSCGCPYEVESGRRSHRSRQLVDSIRRFIKVYALSKMKPCARKRYQCSESDLERSNLLRHAKFFVCGVFRMEPLFEVT